MSILIPPYDLKEALPRNISQNLLRNPKIKNNKPKIKFTGSYVKKCTPLPPCLVRIGFYP